MGFRYRINKPQHMAIDQYNSAAGTLFIRAAHRAVDVTWKINLIARNLLRSRLGDPRQRREAHPAR